MILIFFSVVITLVNGGPYHSFLLPYGPKHGDLFNQRMSTCNQKPFPLGINLGYGNKLLDHAFFCKGGFISFSDGKTEDIKTTDLMAVFWTEDVNFNHWLNPFLDYLCLQIYDYYNAEHEQNLENFWRNLGVNFTSYFYPLDDIMYGDICQKKVGEMPLEVEELIETDNPRSMKWLNYKYDLTNPSAIASKDILLNGNVFKRVDRSPETLDFVTSMIKKLPLAEDFEATWSLVVTWLRTPLSYKWNGWLSQQSVIACDENSSEDAFSRSCFIIWDFEAAGTSPCDDCASQRLPLDVGFYIDGKHYPFPHALNGEIDVSTLVTGTNVGKSGLYIFNFTGGMPTETQYSDISGWLCERDVTPHQCHLYTNNKEIITLKGFFCNSDIPGKYEIEIVFQGAHTSRKVYPLNVDAKTGDIEVFCPFWGVTEVAAGYLEVSGKEKARSTFQILFGTFLDTFGFPPYAVVDALEVENIEHGWSKDFEFRSDNLVIRSVALRGQLNEEQTANHLYLSQHVTMLASNSIAIVDVTSDVNVNYKAVIMQEDFEEMPRTGEEIVRVPIIMKQNISCETWIEEQEKIDISHCHKRFQQDPLYSCETSGLDFVEGRKTIYSLGWTEDLCCSLSGNSTDHFATSGICDHCEFNKGAAFCFYTIPFPCRDGGDVSKEIFHISHKCCYDNTYNLITDYNQGAGGMSHVPNQRHDLASHYKSEIEPWRACCGDKAYVRSNGESSCNAYHRLRPFLEPTSTGEK